MLKKDWYIELLAVLTKDLEPDWHCFHIAAAWDEKEKERCVAETLGSAQTRRACEDEDKGTGFGTGFIPPAFGLFAVDHAVASVTCQCGTAQIGIRPIQQSAELDARLKIVKLRIDEVIAGGFGVGYFHLGLGRDRAPALLIRITLTA